MKFFNLLVHWICKFCGHMNKADIDICTNCYKHWKDKR